MIKRNDYERVEKPNTRGKILGGSSCANYFTWIPGSKASLTTGRNTVVMSGPGTTVTNISVSVLLIVMMKSSTPLSSRRLAEEFLSRSPMRSLSQRWSHSATPWLLLGSLRANHWRKTSTQARCTGLPTTASIAFTRANARVAFSSYTISQRIT